MSWNIPTLKIPDTPPPLQFSRCFIGFIFLIIVIVFGCLLIYHLTHSKTAFLYLLILSAATFIVFGIVVGWKILRAGMLMEKNEIINTSNQKLEEACCAWTSEYMTIVGLSYVFPEGVEIDNFRNGEEFNVIGNKAIKFPAEIEYVSLFHELLSELRSILLVISYNDQVEINFSYSDALTLSMWKSFSIAWKKLGLAEEAIIKPFFLAKDYADQIDDWLDNPVSKYRLIIVCNPLASDTPNNPISDAACAWLLANSTMVENSIPEIARLYRALSSDIESISSDLSNLLKYQKDTDRIRCLWFGQVSDKEVINKVNRLCNDMFVTIEDTIELNHYFTELIAGKQSRNDMWVTQALAFIKHTENNESNLIITQNESRILLNQLKKYH